MPGQLPVQAQHDHLARGRVSPTRISASSRVGSLRVAGDDDEDPARGAPWPPRSPPGPRRTGRSRRSRPPRGSAPCRPPAVPIWWRRLGELRGDLSTACRAAEHRNWSSTAASRRARRGPSSRRPTPAPRCPPGIPPAGPASAQNSSIGSRIFQDSSTSRCVREQRRVAEQHVQDQPLVGLGRGLGERLAVGEVHRDVADLHRGARHLRAEPHRDALVRLHPDDQRVLPELLGVGRR